MPIFNFLKINQLNGRFLNNPHYVQILIFNTFLVTFNQKCTLGISGIVTTLIAIY